MTEEELESLGYTYDSHNKWWTRTWTTNKGNEKVEEVAAFTGKVWRKMLIGEDGKTFFEHVDNPDPQDEKYGEPIERPISAEHHGG